MGWAVAAVGRLYTGGGACPLPIGPPPSRLCQHPHPPRLEGLRVSGMGRSIGTRTSGPALCAAPAAGDCFSSRADGRPLRPPMRPRPPQRARLVRITNNSARFLPFFRPPRLCNSSTFSIPQRTAAVHALLLMTRSVVASRVTVCRWRCRQLAAAAAWLGMHVCPMHMGLCSLCRGFGALVSERAGHPLVGLIPCGIMEP